MAIKGALTTTFAISASKPATRDEAGYDALKTRIIVPTAFTDAEDSLTIPAADYATLIPGEIVSLSAVGSLTGLAVDTDRYLVLLGSNKIAFATSRDEAVKGTGATKVALGGTLGVARVKVNNFKPCGEAASIGEFGREYNTVRVNNLASGATRKFKGSFDQGTIQADLLFDSEDVGQTVLEAAADSTATYAFHVQLPAPAAEEFYFEGLVASLKRIVGGPDDAVMVRCSIELDHHSIIEGTPQP